MYKISGDTVRLIFCLSITVSLILLVISGYFTEVTF